MPGITPSSTTSSSSPGPAIRGKVHGGQQPLVGASVYLYAVNGTGYAGPGIAASTSNAAVSLLNHFTGNPPDSNGHYYVTTASDGSFSITGDYSCLSATPYVYLLAMGGNPGLGLGTNSAITLAATLGDCTADLRRRQRAIDGGDGILPGRLRHRSNAHFEFRHTAGGDRPK